MKSLRRGAVGAAAMAWTIGGWAPDAEAAGFANTRLGGEQGSVVATNPTALYYNPGALGFSQGSQLGLYGALAVRHATWTHAQAPADIYPDPPDAQGANTGEAHLLNVFGGPAFGGTLKLGNLVVGAGFFAPFAGRAHWAKNDAFTNSKYPLAADGVQRWFGIDGEVSILYFTAGAAYRLGPLSIGASGNFISSNFTTMQAKNPGGQGIARTTNEARARFDVQGFNGSFAAGAMLEVLPDQLWIGGSYQAQPGLGPQSLKGTLDIDSVTAGNLHYDVAFTETLPDIVRAGFRWRPRHAPLEFRVFGDYTRWSALLSQCGTIEKPKSYPCSVHSDGSDPSGGTLFNYLRGWSDTYGARVGVSYWIQPEVELLFGSGYETAAVPDATMGPDLADANNIAGTLGGRFMLTQSLFLTASYTHIQYMNRDNTGKSALAAVNGNPVSVPTVQPDGGGHYTQWIGVFNGNVEALF